ncbi:hypothetical protein TWF694_008791 [Orbilia ellipsospora]|uniref:Uncharacterized protein n=1 Tax=Orbilia ellipsospora TaxID=2528407 RepID=A0AAV9XD30_9PEZI
MASNGAAMVLMAPSSGGGFQQTGTVDWGDLAKSTVSLSIDILSRISSGRLDPYTILVGQNLMNSQFRIDNDGRMRLSKAVKDLGVYKGFSEALWFGFGINSPLRALAGREEGMILCGICGALSEGYRVDSSAMILQSMVTLTKAPEHLMPSVLQWQELVRTCSGFLARTSFPTVLDGFIRLIDIIDPRDERYAPGPLDVADVLHGMASITRGEIQSITIKGGRHVAFLAALAEWLFSLTVCITKADGQLLYCKSPSTLGIQVNIILTHFAATDPNSIERVANTYILDNPSELFKQIPSKIYGRVPWDQALSLAFGHDFQRLLDPTLANHYATALGSAFAALRLTKNLGKQNITDTTYVKPKYRPRQFYPMSISAQDLANFMCTCFPELAGLRDSTIEAAANTDMAQIIESWDKSIEVLEKSCGCRSQEPTQHRVHIYCLSGLVDTVLRLIVSLFNVDYPPDLYPHRSGLITTYYECGGKSCPMSQTTAPRARRSSEPESKITCDLFWRLGKLNDTKLVDKRLWNQFLLFEDAFRIFADDDAIQPVSDASAQCANGICVWSSILGGVTGQDAVFGRVKVMPGQIEYHRRPYNLIQDPHIAVSYPDNDFDMSRLTEYSHSVLLLQERIGFLNATLTFGPSHLGPVSSERKKDLRFHIAPVTLMRFVENGRGVVHCDGRGCQQKRVPYEIGENDPLGVSKFLLELKVSNNDSQGTNEYKQVFVIFGPLETRVAFASTVDEDESRWIWRENECFDCCVRSLVKLTMRTKNGILIPSQNLLLFSPTPPSISTSLISKNSGN